MKILSLGLDNSALNKSSALAVRVIEYGNLVEKYTVIVPSRKNENIELSEKVMAYGSGGNNKICRFVKIYNLAKKLLREEKYDVITVQDQYYLALIGLCLAKNFHLGLEIQVHGFEKYYGLRKLIARYVLPRAGAIRCVSQRLKKQLINEFNVKEERITIVPIFVDVNLSLRATGGGAFSPGLDPGNLTDSDLNQRLPRRPEYRASRNDINAFIFLTVGRLVPVKNISLQIKAMSEVVKKYPKTELWIIGDGPEYNNFKFKISNLKLENNIKLFGKKSREELNFIYNKADVFILSSNAEGWGMAVIEAAAAGLPIIMTDVGCAGEVIKNNESGIIIPVGDKEKLIEVMLKIIEDENLRKKLGANAKLAVGKLPNKEQILELYKKSWEKTINKK